MRWRYEWRRPGAEFGGRENVSPTKISEWRFFQKKNPSFTTKISDDLFRIFPLFFQIFRIFTVLNVVYDPFLTIKTTN